MLTSARGKSLGTDWLSRLEPIGGKLVPAARAFVQCHAERMPSPGTAAARWLADQIERLIDDEYYPLDEQLVEGAGAFLGLLLIEHFGGQAREQSGCHRVQLGRHGWFDPFGAIDEVLDADDPRACLSRYLAAAQSEAEQSGPVSKVVSLFASVLAERRPDLSIDTQFGLTLGLSNGVSVDLERLRRALEDEQPEAGRQAAARIVSLLPGSGGFKHTSWEEAAPRLLPRLVSESFIAGLPDEQDLHHTEMGHDVSLTLQLRYGSRSRYVRRSELQAWLSEGARPAEQALNNLVERSRSVRLEAVDASVYRIRQGDGLDGARLMLPDLSARLATLSQSPWLLVAPHRDALLLAPKQPESIRQLRLRAEQAVQRAPHPVSAALFELSPQGLRPFSGQA